VVYSVRLSVNRSGGRVITEPFSEAEYQRFRNLLELASSSPYQGERENALAAAERLAGRHGMTLDEAATGRTQGPAQEAPRAQPNMSQEHDLARVVHLMDYQIQLDKARIAEAMQKAVDRGLDEAERRRAATPRIWRTYRSSRRMEPHRHARVLLDETSLPISEIAGITGLDVHKVAALKLKLRRDAAMKRRVG
jgi:hypothetical protein